jgi:DNA-binding MarR family transcriptional regulator
MLTSTMRSGPASGNRLPRAVGERHALVVYKLGEHVMERAEEPLAAIGLTGRQYVALAVLASDAPSSQLELADLCDLMPAQVVALVDELARRGLAERRRDEKDRRRSVVSITEQGREVLRQADAIESSIEAALFGDLEDAERTRIHDALLAALTRVAVTGADEDSPAPEAG